jgi:hypothetical protein
MNQEQESPSLMNRTACGERVKLWGVCQLFNYLIRAFFGRLILILVAENQKTCWRRSIAVCRLGI